jgi:hypothetical protein
MDFKEDNIKKEHTVGTGKKKKKKVKAANH